MPGVLMRRANGDTHRGKTARGRQRRRLVYGSCKPRNARLAGNHWKLGRNKGGFFPETFRESCALPTIPWFWASNLKNCERIHFWIGKPSVGGILLRSLWKRIHPAAPRGS